MSYILQWHCSYSSCRIVALGWEEKKKLTCRAQVKVLLGPGLSNFHSHANRDVLQGQGFGAVMEPFSSGNQIFPYLGAAAAPVIHQESWKWLSNLEVNHSVLFWPDLLLLMHVLKSHILFLPNFLKHVMASVCHIIITVTCTATAVCMYENGGVHHIRMLTLAYYVQKQTF